MQALRSRAATLEDVALLAQMNKRLIDDERARNPMSLEQLEARMRNWLERGKYQGELFLQGDEVVAYALYRLSPDEYCPEQAVAYIRHFYVERGRRRQGVGRAALKALASTRFPAGCTVSVDVLATNHGGHQFWSKMGFKPYLTNMKVNGEEVV